MKKFLAIALVLVMLLSVTALAACNRNVEEDGSGITNYTEITTFEVKDPSGKLLGTITYKGQGTDKAIITKYTPRISGSHSVVIPEVLPGSERRVAGIANEAFRACTSVSSVTLPDSVEFIGEWAFYLCTNLYEISIPENVTSIGKGAFVQCTSLTDVEFRGETPLVTEIGDYAFNSCAQLQSITIPEGVETVGEGAFFNCYRLKTATLPSTLTALGRTAFANCTKAEKITLGDNIESIGDYAFGTILEESPDVVGGYTEGSKTDIAIKGE